MGRPDPIERRVAARVRELREARGLSQADLGRLMRLSRSSVAQVERGEKSQTVATLEAFAAALGVTVADLVTEQPISTRNPPAEPIPGEMRRLVTMLKTRSPEYVAILESMVALLDRLERSKKPSRKG